MIEKAEQILFRCSGIDNIMSEGRGGITELQLAKIDELNMRQLESQKPDTKVKPLTEKMVEELNKLIHKRDNPELSETVKRYCVDLWVSEVWKRKDFIFGKMLTKGNEREEDAITMLSIHKNRYYEKNVHRLRNEWWQGEPDTHEGESIFKANVTLDTKCSWSANSFFKAQHSALEESYWYQGHGYMHLTGAERHEVVRCLINTPAKLIDDEKKRAVWNFAGNDRDPAYKDYCKQLEINHIFDMKAFIKENPDYDFHINLSDWSHDIPESKRIFIVEFERDMEVRARMIKRADACREFMNKELFKITA